MNIFTMWFLVFVLYGSGTLFLGLYIGELVTIKRLHAQPITGLTDWWWYAGVITLVTALVLAVLVANPYEKLKEHADQIRSSVTAETTVR
ncbi:MAG: hypothetical protein Q8R55_03585 [Candidatus Taylorbacteria bacterium]|nr:hypothetical protein [Candidatus Taylorbacteria bacterium]